MKRWLFAAVFLLWFSVPVEATITCDYCVFYNAGAGGDSGTCTSSPAWDDPYHSVMRTWAAGDIVCVADDHVESTAAKLTILGPNAEGGSDFPQIICVDRSTCTGGGVCEVCDQPSERASVTSASTNDIDIEGKLWIYGIDFTSTDDLAISYQGAGDSNIHIEQSEITLTGSGFDNFWLGDSTTGDTVALVDVDMTFTSAGQGIGLNGGFVSWDGGSLTNNATNLIEQIGSFGQTWFTVRNVDLSVLSGNILFASQAQSSFDVSFVRCKFHASTTLVNGTFDVPRQVLKVHHCQAGTVVDPPYQMAEEHYEGTIQVSTTNVRTGGASDGTTSYAWEFDTSTGSSYLETYEGLCSTIPIPFYVSGGSEVTARVFANGGAGLDDTEIWFNVSEPPVGATSLGVRVSSRPAPGEASSYLTEGAETWTSGTDYYADFTFTPAENGVFMVWPCVATAAKVYIDPKIELQ